MIVGAKHSSLFGTAAQAMFQWLKNNPGTVRANIYELFDAYAAGELTAMEVLGTLLGIASATDLMLLLSAAAINIGALYIAFKCNMNM